VDIDEAAKKLIFQVSMELPGYEQLLPRSQINLKYEIKKILKQYTKDVLKTTALDNKGDNYHPPW
jgi:hypothetical protein